MAFPSINLANDSLGLGSLFQGFSNAKGTDDCGSKPTCISFGKNSQCAQKNKAYADCRMRALELKAAAPAKSVDQPAGNSKVIYIILIAAAILIMIMIFRRRKTQTS